MTAFKEEKFVMKEWVWKHGAGLQQNTNTENLFGNISWHEVTMPYFKVLRRVKKASLLWSGLLYWQQFSQYIYQKQRLLHFVHKDFGAGAVYKQQNNPKVQDAGLNNNLQ